MDVRLERVPGCTVRCTDDRLRSEMDDRVDLVVVDRSLDVVIALESAVDDGDGDDRSAADQF